MRKLPLVTVSIPTYNSAKTLKICLDSINAQSYPKIDINIVDGNSKDGTMKIAEAYKITVINDKHGLLNARKIGSQNAKGDYILLLDSDQVLEPDAIQRAVDKIEARNLDMLVLEENVYMHKTFLEHLFQYDRKLIHAVKDFSPYTGVMLPRFYRRKLLLEAFKNVPKETLEAGGQDHAVIYFEAWQISEKVDLLTNAVKHIEPSSLSEIIPKFYRWGRTSLGARNDRYKDMLRRKEHFRKGMFRRGLIIASIASVALLLIKGVPYKVGVIRARWQRLRK